MKELINKSREILRWSEKYTKTDMVYLAKGVTWLGLGQLTASFTSLFLAIAFAKFIPKEIYGNYKYILSLGGILGAFSLTGISASVVQAVSRGYDGALKEGFRISLRWSIFIFIGSVVAGIYYLVVGNSSLGLSFFIIGIFSPIFNSAQLYISFLNGKKDFRRITILGLWQDFVPVIALISTIIFTKNVVFIIFVYFFSNTIISIFLYKKTLNYYKPKETGISNNLSYSKHLSFMNILAGIGDKIDNVLLFHFFGGTTLSIYAFAIAIPNQIIGLFRTIGPISLPKFAQGDKNLIKKEMLAKVLRFILLLSVVVVIYYFVAQFIYRTFFPEYLESVPYSQLYAIIMIFAAGALPMSFIESQLAVRERYAIIILSNVTRIILMLFLVVPFGIWGIIYSQIATKTIVLSAALILSRNI